MVAGVLLDGFGWLTSQVLLRYEAFVAFCCSIVSSRFQRMKQMKKVIGWSQSWFQTGSS